MKKIALFTILTALFVLSGCQNPIFEAIREDVVPEEATVSGTIGAITRYTAGSQEYLFLAADGGLRYKQKDQSYHGAWASYPLPFSLLTYSYDSSSFNGEELLTVLADSTTLYIISAEWTHSEIEGYTHPSNIKIRGKNITLNSDGTLNTDGEWTLITENNDTLFPVRVDTSTSDDLYYTNFRVFQTNAPMKAHRAAYISAYNDTDSKYHYYQLNGANALDKVEDIEITIDASSIIDPNSSTTPVVNSAVYFGGGVKFFTSTTATTNETYDDEATVYYYTNSSSRLHYSDGASTEGYIDGKYTIRSLATCEDSILIGYGYLGSNSTSSTVTYGGIDRALLNSGIPTGLATFNTNAQFQITSSYIVLALLNATPDKTEEESSIYASITFAGTGSSFDNKGLWSYYPSRKNWNRE